MLLQVVSSHSPKRPLAPEHPGLHVRGPTHGVFDQFPPARWENWLVPSGVQDPSVLAVNLEGRFPTPAALVDLVLPVAKAVENNSLGQLVLIFCTPDPATKIILRALAESHDVAFFIADSVDEIRNAEPAGSLTPTELETLELLHRLGGRTTVSVFAAEASLEPSAANNRLMSVREHGLLPWQTRSRRAGNLFLDARYAVPTEDPADPTAEDFEIPAEVRSDVRALAEMQGRDPRALYAEAVSDFLERHRDHLSTEHDRLQEAIANNDEEALKAVARQYAKKRAQARRQRQAKPPKPTPG